MTEVHDRLQGALTDRYRIEREIGACGAGEPLAARPVSTHLLDISLEKPNMPEPQSQLQLALAERSEVNRGSR
jgi:hypothetical protein